MAETLSMTFSQKWKAKLVYEEHIFNFNRRSQCNERLYWLCEKYDDTDFVCQARLVTTRGPMYSLVDFNGEGHTHNAVIGRAAMLNTVHDMRLQALQQLDRKPTNIVADNVNSNISSTVSCLSLVLCTICTLSNGLQHTRKPYIDCH